MQLSMFDDYEPLKRFLPRYEHVEGNLKKISQFFEREKSVKARADYLKDIYGTGGCYGKGGFNIERYGFQDVNIRHDPEGANIELDGQKFALNWTELAKIIGELAETGAYENEAD